MTRDELRKIATSLDIPNRGIMLKKELETAILSRFGLLHDGVSALPEKLTELFRLRRQCQETGVFWNRTDTAEALRHRRRRQSLSAAIGILDYSRIPEGVLKAIAGKLRHARKHRANGRYRRADRYVKLAIKQARRFGVRTCTAAGGCKLELA